MENLHLETTAGILKNFTISMPATAGTETVTVKIIRIADGYTWNFTTLAFAAAIVSGNMVYVSDSFWKQSFTPPTAGEYAAYIYDETNTITHSITFTVLGYGAAVTATPLAGDLTALATMKEYQELTGTDYDNLLTNLISRVSQFIKNYCHTNFTTEAVTKYHSGDDNEILILDHSHILSFTSLYDDTDRAFGADTLVDAADYTVDLDTGIVYLLNSLTFDKGVRNIKETYNIGYATVPADIAQACIEIVAKKYKDSIGKRLGIASESIGDKNISFTNEDIPKQAKVIMDHYEKKHRQVSL